MFLSRMSTTLRAGFPGSMKTPMHEWTVKIKIESSFIMKRKHYNKSKLLEINKDECGFPNKIHPSEKLKIKNNLIQKQHITL